MLPEDYIVKIICVAFVRKQTK